ncbi:Peptidoglycan-associated lipoprotein [Xanthomonas sp. SI]|nr:Peptidoglycan-associated lipoprotein [Xanthomonas sp. SI]
MSRWPGIARPKRDIVRVATQTPGGQQLEPVLRAHMESRLGCDLSSVRVHTDHTAAVSARRLDAAAYTQGNSIFFGAGRYQPTQQHGQHLLAHELAHVAQPTSSAATGIAAPDHPSEREAHRVADIVTAGGRATPTAARGGAIQRQPLPRSSTLPPLSGGEALLDNASPFLAAAAGSAALDAFDTGRAELKPGHHAQLASAVRNILTLLKQYPLSRIRVIGHADTAGAEASNLALGQDRAAAVKQALVELGIAETLVETSSVGEGEPQAVTTRDGTSHPKNRRVEIRFSPEKMPLRSMLPELTRPGSVVSAPPGPAGATAALPYSLDPLGIRRGTLLPAPPPGPLRPESQALPPDFWKPLPPLPKGAGPRSLMDAIGEEIVDPLVDKVAARLPKLARDKMKSGIRSAIVAGAKKGARAVAEAAGLQDSKGLEAIEKAVEAAIKMNAQEQRP